MPFSSPPPSPIIGMFEQLLPIIAIIAVLGVIARTRPRRKTRRPFPRESSLPDIASASKKSALARARDGTFIKKRLFNNSELRVFGILENEIKLASLPYRVMGQTCMRGFLTTDDKFEKGGSHYAIGDRSMDFVIADADGNVILAVEYNGEGHFKNNSEERDAIKAIALSRAGIPLLTIEADESETLVRGRVRHKLGVNPAT